GVADEDLAGRASFVSSMADGG
ncbi:MAG: hypothetical protein JWQ62_2317, partial [Lacunisphaera sp.]|nr:hypothetical protein [Lacunisphaera sp.]